MTLPKNLDILVDSQFYLIQQLPNGTYILHSVYKRSKYMEDFLKNDIALWSSDSGFIYYNDLSAIRNRSDLAGMVVNISYVITNNDSLNHLWDYRDKHIDGISKLNYILIHHVMNIINASRNFIMRSTWGYKNQTTNIYDGLFGDLQLGLAEFAGTAAFFTADRISIVDFIAPTTPTRAKFIFRAPPLSYVRNVFTLPFTRMVWYTTFLLIGLISIIIYVIVKWEWSESEFRNVLDRKQNSMRPKYIDVLLMELGAVCQQGSESEPRSAAGQITTIFIFITLMFMYISYSANIVALLQSTSDSIKTLDDLLASRIKLGVEDKPYSHYYFKIQTEKTRKAIYTQKVVPNGQKPNFMNIEEGIRRMKDEFFAFHVECASGYKVVADVFQESEKCGLREIEYFQVIDPWVAVKKNSSYKELAKVAFRKLHESGIQNREFRRLYTKKPVCQTRGSNFVSVGLVDCYYAFLIFGVGILITIGVVLIEILHKRKCTNVSTSQ
uniref:Ionotropic receptor 13 n=1 Tax=Holotrichia parallela TaxID=93412 RepID=A0A2P9JY95_HOLPA|nr:ionotropic receptor 13 [Holotrichia parallela]